MSVKDLDCIVEHEAPIIELKPPKIGDIEKAIGEHCASPGARRGHPPVGHRRIPDAVLLFLKHKKDLGIHSEMFSDGVVELAEAGVITNAKKTLHPGKFEVAFLMGTRRLYDFVDHNPDVELRPVDYVNNPFVIAQNENMVSINSCVQVDLMGQVASESIGPKQISGVGGQVDFVRGASASKGGVSIMAMPSTVKGKISKIVPLLDEGRRHHQPQRRGLHRHRVRRGRAEGPDPTPARPQPHRNCPPRLPRRAQGGVREALPLQVLSGMGRASGPPHLVLTPRDRKETSYDKSGEV